MADHEIEQSLSIPERIMSCIQEIEGDLSTITQDSQNALLVAREKQNNFEALSTEFEALRDRVRAYRDGLAK